MSGIQFKSQVLRINVFALTLACTAAAPFFSPQVDAATRTEVKRMVIEEARNSIVPPALTLAVAKVESDFQDRVRSHKGARGVMQIMPATAHSEFGVHADELWDPRLNVQLGVDYLERLYEQYGGSWELALSHYNGGTLRGGTGAEAKPHGYTRKYVADVTRWWKRYQDQADVWGFAAAMGQSEDAWVPARTKVASAETQGEADPKSDGDAEYRLRAKVQALQVTPTVVEARSEPHPVVRWREQAMNIKAVQVAYPNQTTNNGGFWFRLANARETLDDFTHTNRRPRF